MKRVLNGCADFEWSVGLSLQTRDDLSLGEQAVVLVTLDHQRVDVGVLEAVILPQRVHGKHSATSVPTPKEVQSQEQKGMRREEGYGKVIEALSLS